MKSGFTLLESLVYLLLTTLILGLSAHVAALFYHTMSMRLESTSSDVLPLLAFHTFKKDIQKASTEETLWKCIKASTIVFSDGIVDYGWTREKECLIRYQGVFNIKTKKWNSSTKSKVLPQVKSLSFKVHKEECIRGVEIKLSLKESSIPLKLFLAVKAGPL